MATGMVSYPDGRDPIVLNQMRKMVDLVNNATLTRRQVSAGTDNRRDIDQECGYPETTEISSQDYRQMYDREGIATRVVEIWPKECWQSNVSITEDDDAEVETPFELAFDQVGMSLKGESWHEDEEGNPIWEYLRRADILTRIGSFGILLMGIDDGKPLREAVEGFEKGFPKLKPEYGSGEGDYPAETSLSQSDDPLLTPGGAEKLDKLNSPPDKELTPEMLDKQRQDRKEQMAYNFDANNEEDDVPVNGKPPGMDDEEWERLGQNDPNVGDEQDQQDLPIEPNYGGSLEDVNLETEEPVGPEVEGADGEEIQGGSDYLDPERSAEESGNKNLDEFGQPTHVETKYKLLYLRAFDESLVNILQYERDPNNPRYGQPLMYQVTFVDPQDSHPGIGVRNTTEQVHWSRVIHLTNSSDNVNSSEIIGVPAQRPVFNRLLDLKKLYGGSAEMFWMAAFMGISWETHPELGSDITIDYDALEKAMERYRNSLQRHIATEGLSANQLAPQVSDPSLQIDVQITAICITINVPKRIFMGSEQAELASSQDSETWKKRVRERQKMYLTPRIIVPFVDRLIAMGVLPQPVSYKVQWEDIEALGSLQKAQVATARMGVMAQYVSGGIDVLMSPTDLLTRELDFTEDEATAILEGAQSHMMEVNPDVGMDELVPGHGPEDPQLQGFDENGQPIYDDGTGDGSGQPGEEEDAGGLGGFGQGNPEEGQGVYGDEQDEEELPPQNGFPISRNAFEESKHPRDHGKFANKGGGSSGSSDGGSRFYQRYPEHAAKAKASEKQAHKDLRRQKLGEFAQKLKGHAKAILTEPLDTGKGQSKEERHLKSQHKKLAHTILGSAARSIRSRSGGKGSTPQHIEAHGTQGDAKKPFRLKFKNKESLDRWAKNNKAEIHGTSDGSHVEGKKGGRIMKVARQALGVVGDVGKATAKHIGRKAVEHAIDSVVSAYTRNDSIVTNHATIDPRVQDLAEPLIQAMINNDRQVIPRPIYTATLARKHGAIGGLANHRFGLNHSH